MGKEMTFLVFFAVFSAILMYAGFITRKWVTDSSDFILAGREVSMLINIFGVAAIGYAGTSIALAPGFGLHRLFGHTQAWHQRHTHAGGHHVFDGLQR